MIFRKLLAFLWKDWVEARSYRMAFMVQNLSMLLPLIMLYFVGRMFNGVDLAVIDRYGGNYVTFALVGIVVTTYSATALRAFSTSMRKAQVNGTLEALLSTRASLPTIVLGWSLYPFMIATVSTTAFLVAGFLILGLPLGEADLASALLTLVLTVATMGSLGILAASFTLVFHQGDPFTGIVVMASGLLSGAVYPVTVLPEWLQEVARFLPQTHVIEAMRLSVLQGFSIRELAPEFGALTGFAVIFLPVALLVFNPYSPFGSNK